MTWRVLALKSSVPVRVRLVGAKDVAQNLGNDADRDADQNEQEDGKVLVEVHLETFGSPNKQPKYKTRVALIVWCRRRDSNSHSFRHYPLKIACLPISPRRQDALSSFA